MIYLAYISPTKIFIQVRNMKRHIVAIMIFTIWWKNKINEDYIYFES
jgi:hypothetical protein